MASRPIEIPITVDADGAEKGVSKVADSLEKVETGLKDLGKTGGKTGKALESDMSDAAKKIDRDLTKALRDVEDTSQPTGKGIGRNVKDGTDKASEGLSELKDESASTAKEAAASFGSVEDSLDAIQEIAANALAGFGPAGAAAGVAMAVGIGIAVTAMQDGAEKATELKQKAVDMVDTIAEAGGDISNLDLAETIKAWGREVLEDNWITFWADESSTKFQETAKDAKDFGVTTRDAIRAASGSAEDSRKFLDATADDWQNRTKEIEASASVTDEGAIAFTEAGKAAQKKRDALSDLRGQAEENIKVTENAVEIYNIETDALGQTEEAAKKAADAIKEKADASDRAANAAMDVVGAENNWITTLAQMTADIKVNGQNLDANTAAGRANRESLVDIAEAANDYRDRMIAAGDSTATITQKVHSARDAFINQAVAAGMARDKAGELADSYGLIPANVETLVKANGTEEAKAKIEAIPEAKEATVTTTETGSAEVQGKIDAVTGKEVEVEVKDDSTIAGRNQGTRPRQDRRGRRLHGCRSSEAYQRHLRKDRGRSHSPSQPR